MTYEILIQQEHVRQWFSFVYLSLTATNKATHKHVVDGIRERQTDRQADRRRDGFKNSKHNPSRIYSLANVRNPCAQFSIIMALISGRAIRLLTVD